MLEDPYSLVEGVDSPIIPLITLSDDSLSDGEFVCIDDLQKSHPLYHRSGKNI